MTSRRWLCLESLSPVDLGGRVFHPSRMPAQKSEKHVVERLRVLFVHQVCGPWDLNTLHAWQEPLQLSHQRGTEKG